MPIWMQAASPKEGSKAGSAPRLSVTSGSSSVVTDNLGHDLHGDDDSIDDETNEDNDNGTNNDNEDESIVGLPKDVGKLKKLEAQLGIDKNDQVYLIVKGLPRDIDMENVEFVQADRNPGVNDNDSNQDQVKRKLKIICLDPGKNRSKGWKNNGPFKVKFRTPYSKKEDFELLSFLRKWKTKKGSLPVGGTKIWKLMEKKKLCKGRSWESMKERWRGHLVDNLAKFDIDGI